MLYCTEIEVSLPLNLDESDLDSLKIRERVRAEILQKEGKLVHLWRVSGKTANISIWDCESNDELHGLLSSLPMFRYFHTRVVPLSRHPSAINL